MRRTHGIPSVAWPEVRRVPGTTIAAAAWNGAPCVVAMLLALAASVASAQVARATPAQDSTRVVFVCEHGSVKSLVAVAYFNRTARERGLPFSAISRGTNPDSLVPGPIRDGLARDGFDVSTFRPIQFAAGDVQGAALLVAFDQDVSATLNGTVPIARWDSLPALSRDYRVGRDSIRARVAKLVVALAAKARFRRH